MRDELSSYVRQHDYEHYIAALLTKELTARRHMLAVLALTAEIKRIAHLTHEPMTAYVRLAWWRERIDDLYAGKEPPQQMTLQALQPFIAERAPPKEWFLQIVESGAAFEDTEKLEAFGERGESVARLLAWAAGNAFPEPTIKKIGEIDGKLALLAGRRIDVAEHFLENLETEAQRIKPAELNGFPTLGFMHAMNTAILKKQKSLIVSSGIQPEGAPRLAFLPFRALIYNLLTL